MVLFYPVVFHIANGFLRFLTEREFYREKNIYHNIASSCSGISVMLSQGSSSHDGRDVA